jgi:hypothetical protein
MMRQPAFLLRDIRTDQEYRVTPAGLRIGRTVQNDVVLADDKVSRHHATLWSQDDQLYIRDDNSTNGTWVNGERISDPRALREGDRVRLGETVFRVAVGPAPVVPAETAAAPPGRRFPLVPVAIAGGAVLLILIGFLLASRGGPPKTPTETPTGTPTRTATVRTEATETAGLTSTPMSGPAATDTRSPATSTLRPTRTSAPPTSTSLPATPTRIPATRRPPAPTRKATRQRSPTPTRIPATAPPPLTPTRIPPTPTGTPSPTRIRPTPTREPTGVPPPPVTP